MSIISSFCQIQLTSKAPQSLPSHLACCSRLSSQCCLSPELYEIQHLSWAPLYFLWSHLRSLPDFWCTALNVHFKSCISYQINKLRWDLSFFMTCNSQQHGYKFNPKAWNPLWQTLIFLLNNSQRLPCRTKRTSLLDYHDSYNPFLALTASCPSHLLLFHSASRLNVGIVSS